MRTFDIRVTIEDPEGGDTPSIKVVQQLVDDLKDVVIGVKNISKPLTVVPNSEQLKRVKVRYHTERTGARAFGGSIGKNLNAKKRRGVKSKGGG